MDFRIRDADLLQLWESAFDVDEDERALAILAGLSGEPLNDLVELTLGARDRRLYALRRSIFGSHAALDATCEACAQRLEADCDLDAIFADTSTPYEPVDSSDTARLPTTADVLAIRRNHHDVRCARSALIERCFGGQVSDERAGIVADRMLRADPLLECELTIACPRCAFVNRVRFDIGLFFLHELRVMLDRLLESVAMLARTYSWSEREILSLPRARRDAYLRLALR